MTARGVPYQIENSKFLLKFHFGLTCLKCCFVGHPHHSVSEPRLHSSLPNSIYLDRGAMAAEKE